MAKNLRTYKCNICGNVITMNRDDGGGQLTCCETKMNLLTINHDKNATGEKHIPILEKIDEYNYTIKIKHPMMKEHYIEYIEVLTGNNERLTFFLNPKDKPEIVFYSKNKIISVRSYCNLHGIWENIL